MRLSMCDYEMQLLLHPVLLQMKLSSSAPHPHAVQQWEPIKLKAKAWD